MKIFILLTFSFIIFASFSVQQSTNGANNIVFDLADLTVDYETNYGWISLEAFKSSSNDLIIKNEDTKKYGQLNWLSIGHPKLVQTLNTTSNKFQLFNFRPEGFDVSVEMLTNSNRMLFKNLIKQKYDIEVDLNQIVSLIPSRFECQMIFYKDNDKVIINGRVNQLTRLPLKLSFSAPLKTKERILFEERLRVDQSNLDIDIFCEVSSQGKAYRENTLIITGSQINQIGLIDEIFGPASETFVSRNQVSSISSKLYLRLNVIEEYQMPETQFKESFIDDFIKQTSITINQYVSIDQALSQLSRYDFSEDIKPSVIKDEFSRLFYVNKTNSKEFLQLNSTQYEKLNQASSSSGSASAKVAYKLFSGSASANYAKSQKSDWEKLGIAFSEQLNELNSYSENQIEWGRSGNIIIPKSLKVSRLSKSLFNKNLFFSRVKKEFYDAPFKRQFILETLNTDKIPQYIAEYSEKIKSLEKSINENDKKMDNFQLKNANNFNQLSEQILALNNTSTQSQITNSNSFKNLNDIIQNNYNYFKNQFQLLSNLLNEVNGRFYYNQIVQGSFRSYNYPNDMGNKNQIINYGLRFKTPPAVFLTFSNIDTASDIRMATEAVNINENSFELVLRTWSGTRIYGVTVIWTAIGRI